MSHSIDKANLKRRTRQWLETYISIPLFSLCATLVLRIRRPLVIAVTGSVGKTTTKETIAAVLTYPGAAKCIGRVRKTPGNMNNDFGVPLTVLGYDDWINTGRQWIVQLLLLPFRTLYLATVAPFPDVLVLEMSAGPNGNLKRTSRIARPHIAAVTEVGPAHLEHFGSVKGVAGVKVELVRAARASGLVVLNGDNPLVAAMADQSAGPVIMVHGRGQELAQHIARTVARHLGIPEQVTDEALSDPLRVPRRLEEIRVGDMTIIDDAFNANPLSMKLALDVLNQNADGVGRRVAVLGTMAELGEAARQYHQELGAYARQRADLRIGVGAYTKEYGPDYWFEDSQSCAAQIRSLLRPGDRVMVKGSASVRLQWVVRAIKAPEHGATTEPGAADLDTEALAPEA